MLVPIPYRPCGYCGLHNTAEGHDGCIGTLPNVMNAGCGHGCEMYRYIQYLNGECVRGHEALEIMQKHSLGGENDD